MSLVDLWPLFALRITTPRLELRLPTDEELAALATRAAGNVVALDDVFLGDWVRLPQGPFERNLIQYHWQARGLWRAEEWNLQLVTFHNGEPVGVMRLGAKHFHEVRAVSTGSWLLREHQRQGLGTEMRAAVLQLAFDHLGALEAQTVAHEANLGSQGVSRRLDYQPNGERRDFLRGQGVRSLVFRLDRASWRTWPEIAVEGLDDEVRALFGAG